MTQSTYFIHYLRRLLTFPVKLLPFKYRNNALSISVLCVLGLSCFLLYQTLFDQRDPTNDMYGNRNYKKNEYLKKIENAAVLLTKLNETDIENGIEDPRIKHLLPFRNRMHHKHPHEQNIKKEDPEPYIQREENLQLYKTHCSVYDINQPVSFDYDCVKLNVTPQVPVCLYPLQEDIHISYHIKTTGLWEPHIVEQFQNILRSNSGMGVIDIGANIGVYSLVAAHMGHKVVAVEPFLNNIHHFQQASQIGNVEQYITLLKNAVLDKRGVFELGMDYRNQGGVIIDVNSENRQCLSKDCFQTTTIFLDDLLEVIKFKQAIMKIDIEGFEHLALRYSSRLFKEINIPYIIMEWLKLGEFYGSEITETRDKTLTNMMVKWLTEQGYVATSLVNGEKLRPSYWYAWPNDILWKRKHK